MRQNTGLHEAAEKHVRDIVLFLGKLAETVSDMPQIQTMYGRKPFAIVGVRTDFVGPVAS